MKPKRIETSIHANDQSAERLLQFFAMNTDLDINAQVTDTEKIGNAQRHKIRFYSVHISEVKFRKQLALALTRALWLVPPEIVPVDVSDIERHKKDSIE